MKLPIKKITLRGKDPTGNGWYGASRNKGKREHEGLDIVSVVGEPIMSMISGKIRTSTVYNGSEEMTLVEIKNSTYKVKQMYVRPSVKTGDFITEGQIIGYAQDIAGYHDSDMKNHIHISVWKNGLLTDPEPLIKLLLIEQQSPEVFNHWDLLLKQKK